MRKIDAENTTFSTIESFKRQGSAFAKYKLMVIDECSTVSNKDMVEVLQKANFEMLLLVGDTYQIDAIQFGNWFSVLKAFLPERLSGRGLCYRVDRAETVYKCRRCGFCRGGSGRDRGALRHRRSVMAAHLTEESVAKMFADLPAYRDLPLPVALCALFLPGDLIKAVIAALVTATVARRCPESLLSRA